MKYLYFSMQVLRDWMIFPIWKGLVPCMEMCQLHNCQHTWENLSRSLLDWLKSFNKALKSSHADTEHPPEWLQTACELLQCVGEGSLSRTWSIPLLSSLNIPCVTLSKNGTPLCCVHPLPGEGAVAPACFLSCFYLVHGFSPVWDSKPCLSLSLGQGNPLHSVPKVSLSGCNCTMTPFFSFEK